MPLINLDFRTKIFFVVVGCIFISLVFGIAFKLTTLDAVDDKGNETRTPTSTWTMAEFQQKLDPDLKKIEQNSLRSEREKAEALLNTYPIFDGHNNLPWSLQRIFNINLDEFDFQSTQEPWRTGFHTNLDRLRKGHVRAQIWVVYTQEKSQGDKAAIETLLQLDIIHRLVDKYPDDLVLCLTAQCVMETSLNKNERKIASLIGLNGAHFIQSNLWRIRQLYYLGVRYVTLAHPWNTSRKNDHPNNEDGQYLEMSVDALSTWESEFIYEMNHIGMIVVLSHASDYAITQALKRSKAPIILSHAELEIFCDFDPEDNVLESLKKNGGLVMINFNNNYVNCERHQQATLSNVVHHMQRIRDLIGSEHIGLGAEYDGINTPARGLENVSKYPHLFACLIKNGWKLNDLKKISFTNMLRVMEAVEQVKEQLSR